MKKIISLFQRNYDGDRLVRDEVTPGAEWVIAGGGIATRKYDGTCCLVKDGILYKRYDAKHGKTPPAGFVPAQEPDPVTGHWPGWLAVSETDPADQYHRLAWQNWSEDEAGGGGIPVDDTYELCGPKVQGNLEGLGFHQLIRHGIDLLKAPRTFAELRDYLGDGLIEGIVWHHPDERMVKIKAKDFGIKRTKEQS